MIKRHETDTDFEFNNIYESSEVNTLALVDKNENIEPKKPILNSDSSSIYDSESLSKSETIEREKEINFENERSIYDTYFETIPLKNNYEEQHEEKKEASLIKSDENLEKEEKAIIIIKDPTTTVEYENVANNLEYLNIFIEKLKEEEEYQSDYLNNVKAPITSNNKTAEIRNIRSTSTLSTMSSLESESSLNVSIMNSASHEPSLNNFVTVDSFDDVIFKFVDAAAFILQSNTFPSNWTENEITNKNSSCNLLNKNVSDKKSDWRAKIYDSLIKRNNTPFQGFS